MFDLQNENRRELLLKKIVSTEPGSTRTGYCRIAPKPKRPMHERPKLFLERPNYVSRAPQIKIIIIPYVLENLPERPKIGFSNIVLKLGSFSRAPQNGYPDYVFRHIILLDYFFTNVPWSCLCNKYLKPDFALKCMLEILTFTLNKHHLHERPPNEIILFWTKINVGVRVPKFGLISRAPQNGNGFVY